MRRIASALILTALAMAFSASAGLAAKRSLTTADAAASSALDGLRGPLGAAKPKPLQSPVPALASTYSPLAAPASTPDSCRLACARTYYFCLSSENADQCSQLWIHCRLPCAQLGDPTATHP